MHTGQGRGLGMGRGGAGRGRGRGKMLFLETCLLVLLRREPGYGYSLMQGLQAFGFDPEAMDISILYRALRELEAEGLIGEAPGSEKSLGPQRRMVAITAQGTEVLAQWMQTMQQRRRDIEALEAAYAASVR